MISTIGTGFVFQNLGGMLAPRFFKTKPVPMIANERVCLSLIQKNIALSEVSQAVQSLLGTLDKRVTDEI